MGGLKVFDKTSFVEKDANFTFDNIAWFGQGFEGLLVDNLVPELWSVNTFQLVLKLMV